MPRIDPHALNLWDVLYESGISRLTPQDSTSSDYITIRRELFDKLVSVVEAVSACSLATCVESVTIRKEEEKFLATMASKVLGEVHAEGRTIIEAIERASVESGRAIDRLIG